MFIECGSVSVLSNSTYSIFQYRKFLHYSKKLKFLLNVKIKCFKIVDRLLQIVVRSTENMTKETILQIPIETDKYLSIKASLSNS